MHVVMELHLYFIHFELPGFLPALYRRVLRVGPVYSLTYDTRGGIILFFSFGQQSKCLINQNEIGHQLVLIIRDSIQDWSENRKYSCFVSTCLKYICKNKTK